MSRKSIYLDNASATPLHPAVFAAMKPYYSKKFYNPSATYLAAKEVKRDIEAARKLVAQWLGAQSSEIVFTAGGTEANNLAIKGVMDKHPDKNMVVSAVEHESILAPARLYDCRLAPVLPGGRLDLDALRQLINDDTVLVSIIYANNEIGTIQPLSRIAELLGDIRTDRASRGVDTPIFFHSDACQAGAYLDLHVNRLGLDLMTLNGSKIYGPKQLGALYIKRSVNLAPQIDGGGQERGVRSGTENVAGIIGFATALNRVQPNRKKEAQRIKDLSHMFIDRLIQQFPDLQINGMVQYRLPNNVHVTFPGQDNERLLIELDEAGIQCAAGSACSASSDKPSHVLSAIGLSEEEARSSIRFSLGDTTSEGDITYVVKTLKKLIS